jgi:phosphoglycolate phosphatase-like HAD superfamily hydrolase
MSIQLCLFDLDDTLLRTGDLEPFRGGQHVGAQPTRYKQQLLAAFDANPSRQLYSVAALSQLRHEFPALKWGVFTRSPREYAHALLERAYQGLAWDVVIAFEDVALTKPHGEGIWKAMQSCGIKDVSEVVLVGENKADILSAYRGGCWAVLDQLSWPDRRTTDNWRSLERVPDALITGSADLREFLLDPLAGLPELERAIVKGTALRAGQTPRFGRIGHFKPRSLGGGTDRNKKEPKVRANLLLGDGRSAEKVSLLRCPVEALERLIILRGRDDYDRMMVADAARKSGGPPSQGALL